MQIGKRRAEDSDGSILRDKNVGDARRKLPCFISSLMHFPISDNALLMNIHFHSANPA
jgi:hypothetical protein